MRKVLMFAFAGALLAGTAVTAVAEDGDGGPGGGADPVVRALTCTDRKVEIGYDGQRRGYQDWYGLYNGQADKNDWKKNIVSTVEGVGWKYARNGSSLLTNTQQGDRLHAVYWKWSTATNGWAIQSDGTEEDKDCTKS
ncbi:hypothetical protein [Streptomyces chrestomyceticus]|uniref:hypothetical protein n=1 Tax=Streptomyces chrestomyceticus TaxID=68185 RepID=UPI0033D8DE62